MRVMRHAIVPAFALGLLFSACMDAGPDHVESNSQPILGGTAAVAGQFPTTVAVMNAGLCTGTLIAPDLVLTAAHCVSASLLGVSSQEQVTNQTQVVLDTDNVFDGSGRAIRAAETIPNPGFSINALGDNDIALIRLQTPVTDRQPTPINRIREDANVGIAVTQVGYGVSQVGTQQAGRLFSVLNKATTSCSPFGASDANLLCFSQVDGTGKCEGDSGGPSFATINGIQRVVGVTSFGDQNCSQFGADTRVDAELDFLYSHAPALQCQADGACNDDCGTGELPIDPDCSVCTKDAECEDAEVCANDGRCVPAPFTPGGDGSECLTNDDCGSKLCAMDDQGGSCTSTCASDDECSDGFSCVEAGTENICWPKSGDSGGCSVGGTAPAPLGSLLFALGMFLLARRRRQR